MANRFINIYDRATLEQKLAEESFDRTTISFYKYVVFENLTKLRQELYKEWEELSVLGRIYISKEGINAQLSIPSHNLNKFRAAIDAQTELTDVPFKVGLLQSDSFIKLTIKLKNQIVADGLLDNEYDITNVGRRVEPKEFNEAMDDPETIVVDMRNQYESRIGFFDGAILPDADSFKEELPMVADMLKGREEKKVVLYCTGGIRCEKASAYLKHRGFQDVNQLHGGIIAYGHAVKNEKIENKFRGKNFVFDERLAERVSEEIVSECDLCGTPSDNQINCANQMCHLLFIQCKICNKKLPNVCSKPCYQVIQLPEDRQRQLRKGLTHPTARNTNHYRLRPKLRAQ